MYGYINERKMIDLTTSIGGIELKYPVYNASGPFTKEKSDLERLAIACSGAVLSKTCTLEPRTGNVKPRRKIKDYCSLNSDGLDNYGVNYYADFDTESKPYIVSVLADE